MKIPLAHVIIQRNNVAVFGADAPSRSASDRSRLLLRLVLAARGANLRVDKAALAFTEGGKLSYFGADDLVRYLANRSFPPDWTHTIDF